jgi:hypothetical protein
MAPIRGYGEVEWEQGSGVVKWAHLTLFTCKVCALAHVVYEETLEQYGSTITRWRHYSGCRDCGGSLEYVKQITREAPPHGTAQGL